MLLLLLLLLFLLISISIWLDWCDSDNAAATAREKLAKTKEKRDVAQEELEGQSQLPVVLVFRFIMYLVPLFLMCSVVLQSLQ